MSPTFGYAEREFPEKNDTWLPRTVSESFKLRSNAKSCIAVLVDLKTMEYIPMDIDSHCIITTGDANVVLNSLEVYVKPPKPSVYDLLKWHMEARNAKSVSSNMRLQALKDHYFDFNNYQKKEWEEYSFNDFFNSYIKALELMEDAPPLKSKS